MPCYCTYRDDFRLYAPRRTADASDAYQPIGLSDIEKLREHGRLFYKQLEGADEARRAPPKPREGE